MPVGVEHRPQGDRQPDRRTVLAPDARLVLGGLPVLQRLHRPFAGRDVIDVDELFRRTPLHLVRPPPQEGLRRRRHPLDRRVERDLEHQVGRVLGEQTKAGLGLDERLGRPVQVGHVGHVGRHRDHGAAGVDLWVHLEREPPRTARRRQAHLIVGRLARLQHQVEGRVPPLEVLLGVAHLLAGQAEDLRGSEPLGERCCLVAVGHPTVEAPARHHRAGRVQHHHQLSLELRPPLPLLNLFLDVAQRHHPGERLAQRAGYLLRPGRDPPLRTVAAPEAELVDGRQSVETLLAGVEDALHVDLAHELEHGPAEQLLRLPAQDVSHRR